MSKLKQKKTKKSRMHFAHFHFSKILILNALSFFTIIIIFRPCKKHTFFPHNLHWRIGSDHSHHRQADTYKAHTSILIPFFKRNDFYFCRYN